MAKEVGLSPDPGIGKTAIMAIVGGIGEAGPQGAHVNNQRGHPAFALEGGPRQVGDDLRCGKRAGELYKHLCPGLCHARNSFRTSCDQLCLRAVVSLTCRSKTCVFRREGNTRSLHLLTIAFVPPTTQHKALIPVYLRTSVP